MWIIEYCFININIKTKNNKKKHLIENQFKNSKYQHT